MAAFRGLQHLFEIMGINLYGTCLGEIFFQPFCRLEIVIGADDLFYTGLLIKASWQWYCPGHRFP
jgi:hypothetical protein